MWTETNTQQQLIEGVLKHGPDILEHCLSSDDIQQYLDRVASNSQTTDRYHTLVYSRRI